MQIEKSCGAVLFTEIGGIRHYVLVRTAAGDNCGLPKGHMEGAETEQETALREILEETCVSAVIIDGFRKEIEYAMPNGNIKRVVYFAARYDNQKAKNNPAESLSVILLPFNKAMEALSFANIKEVLSDADSWLSCR